MNLFAKGKKSQSDHTFDSSEVIKSEIKYLRLSEKETVTGLALSGGGIRSATFALGVLQALVSKNLLRNFDYMSTVSGGGLIGSALTWALHQGGEKAGTLPENFPLGQSDEPNSGKKSKYLSYINGESSTLLEYIRQHCSYITPTSKLSLSSIFAVVLSNITISLIFYGGLLSCFFVLIYVLLIPQTRLTYGTISTLFFFTIMVLSLLNSFAFLFNGKNKSLTIYIYFLKFQNGAGMLLKLVIFFIILGSLPYTTFLLYSMIRGIFSSIILVISGIGICIWQIMKKSNNENKLSFLAFVGIFLTLYGFALFSYIVSISFLEKYNLDSRAYEFTFSFYILLVFVLGLGFVVDINRMGLHQIWSYRLMEAFMPNISTVRQNQWNSSNEAISGKLNEMCDLKNQKPYHLINANMILVNSKSTILSNRGGHNFILSPLFCGGDLTGWKQTVSYKDHNKSDGLTLGTAMAISSAALNPNSGVAGKGVTRNTSLSKLLSLMNLRLGYWIINPMRKSILMWPNLIIPGLTSEILGVGFNEKSRHIQLSDGGHFENLGLYELIRRKINLIVISDAGEDLNYDFSDLSNAILKIKLDFRATIRFRKDFDLDGILTGSAFDKLIEKRYDIRKNGFAIADILYDDKTTGILIYLKAAIIDNLPDQIYSYKLKNPLFPQQSTQNQFFDEEQFEAYRELGFAVTLQMLNSTPGNTIFNDN